ncbi:unnamed protein product [Prunus armeniaca]
MFEPRADLAYCAISGPDRSDISEACEDCNSACEDRYLVNGCSPDRSSISEDCEDCGSACKDR